MSECKNCEQDLIDGKTIKWGRNDDMEGFICHECLEEFAIDHAKQFLRWMHREEIK